MSTMDTYTDRLSDYLDDELDAAERADVERHLASCGECRTTLGELREVAVRASRLQDSPPRADLWPGVADRLEAGPAHASVVPFRASRRFSFTLPQLVAASLALMILSGSMVWMMRAGGPRADVPPIAASADLPAAVPVTYADAQFNDAIADLQQTLEQHRAQLDPDTVRILETNLKAIDVAIEECRRALQSDPANPYLASRLAESQRRKIALLRRATAIAEGAS